MVTAAAASRYTLSLLVSGGLSLSKGCAVPYADLTITHVRESMRMSA